MEAQRRRRVDVMLEPAYLDGLDGESIDQLRQLEREVSDRRQALHEVIDRIQIELAARHKLERT
jgi:hypothetical protein